MPAIDAYDDEPFYYEIGVDGEQVHDYAPHDNPQLYLNNTSGKWYHATPHELKVGDVLTPAGGDRAWENKDLPPARSGWVWMDSKEGIEEWHDGLVASTMREYGHDVPIHVYEVTPHEGPHPWNGTGREGHVAPSATVTAKIPTAHIDGWPTIQWAE
jgi:hypothetical protein